MQQPNKPLYVSGFQRGPGGIEIQYYESREQSNTVGMTRSIVLSDTVQEYNQLVEEAIESLEELIDLALIDLRSPTKKLGPKERILAGIPLEEEDEDTGE